MKDFLKKHKIKIGVICTTIVLAVGVFFAIPNDYKVFAKTDSFEIELGSQIDNNISTYIWGFENAVKEAQLDTSSADIFTAGSYQIFVKIGNRSIPYDLIVVDTVAPVLTINPEVEYIAIEREYDPYKFISEVTDLSNTSEVYFKVNDALQDTISFETTGDYTLTFVATDISGNETEQSTTITAEIPPRFMGLADTTIPVGADFDYSQYFVIYDETDGFITDSVSIEDEGVDFSEEGTYEIVYSVVNSKGVDNYKTISITTSDEASNDYKYETNLTSEDWDILVDNGYFQYELLEETNTDIDKVVELVKPISINLTKHYSETTKTAGSGFIYKIEENYLYGLSVKHVLDHMTGEAHISFFNDTTLTTTIESVNCMPNNELALFRMDISNLPKETLYALKEAYIDVSYYDEIPANTQLIHYSENHGFQPNFRQQIKVVTLENVNEPNVYMDYIDTALSTTSKVVSGMSGGPTIDYQGRVLGSISYKTVGSATVHLDYSMKLDRIDELVEKLAEKYD